MSRTSKKVTKSFLPAAVKTAMKENNVRKNFAHIVTFADPTRTIRACDTQYSGGTRNAYYTLAHGASGFVRLWLEEGAEFTIPEGYAVVILAEFCGQTCAPQIYIRNQDAPAFFGVEGYPAELPAEVAADWIEEQAEHAKPQKKKRLVAAANALRELYSVGEHGAAV